MAAVCGATAGATAFTADSKGLAWQLSGCEPYRVTVKS